MEPEKQIVLRLRCFIRVRSEVVSFNALCENFAGQMLIFRYFSGITAPAIAGYHADTERRQQGQ